MCEFSTHCESILCCAWTWHYDRWGNAACMRRIVGDCCQSSTCFSMTATLRMSESGFLSLTLFLFLSLSLSLSLSFLLFAFLSPAMHLPCYFTPFAVCCSPTLFHFTWCRLAFSLLSLHYNAATVEKMPTSMHVHVNDCCHALSAAISYVPRRISYVHNCHCQRFFCCVSSLASKQCLKPLHHQLFARRCVLVCWCSYIQLPIHIIISTSINFAA